MNHNSHNAAPIALKTIISVLLSVMVSSCGVFSASADDNRIIGDIDKDGEITCNDALKILRHSTGLDLLGDDDIPYADVDGDKAVTSGDALYVLKGYSHITAPKLVFPEELTVLCGERPDIIAVVEPADLYDDVTIEYIIGDERSTDGLTDKDGNAYKVLEYTSTEKIKAFHPGTATITAVASNGLTAKCTVTVEDREKKVQLSSLGRTTTVTTGMMTKNDCYNETEDFEDLQGFMLHSTSTPGVMAADWYDAWNHEDPDAAVHAFVDDKEVCSYLPLDQTSWHARQPANSLFISVEMCEPEGFYYNEYNEACDYDVLKNSQFFYSTWDNAALYMAYLCQLYGMTEDNVLSHKEGGEQGLATNHSDPDDWFELHGATMDEFRAQVAEYLEEGVTVTDISDE